MASVLSGTMEQGGGGGGGGGLAPPTFPKK